jgi:hypothetical protein
MDNLVKVDVCIFHLDSDFSGTLDVAEASESMFRHAAWYQIRSVAQFLEVSHEVFQRTLVLDRPISLINVQIGLSANCQPFR